MAVAVGGCGIWWCGELYELCRRLRRPRRCADLFDRADADAIGLSKCTVNGASFRDAHLGAANHGGSVIQVSVTESGEPFARSRFIDGGLKRPATVDGIAKFRY